MSAKTWKAIGGVPADESCYYYNRILPYRFILVVAVSVVVVVA